MKPQYVLAACSLHTTIFVPLPGSLCLQYWLASYVTTHLYMSQLSVCVYNCSSVNVHTAEQRFSTWGCVTGVTVSNRILWDRHCAQTGFVLRLQKSHHSAYMWIFFNSVFISSSCTCKHTHSHWCKMMTLFIRSCNWLLLTENKVLLAVFVLIQWITVPHKPAWGQNRSPLDSLRKKFGGGRALDENVYLKVRWGSA